MAAARSFLLIATFVLILFAISVHADQVCYNSVVNIPTNCTDGTISQDTVSGTCRTIVCGSNIGNLKVLACDKPDTGTKTHFEMYRQSYSGAIPQICIDGSCIQYNGFASSSNYPICIQNNTQTNDLGAQGSLRLVQGVFFQGQPNQQTVTPSDRILHVPAGQVFQGDVTLNYVNPWSSVSSLGVAATWGDRTTNFGERGEMYGNYTRTLQNTFQAPQTPGTYHLTFTVLNEPSAANILSMTDASNVNGNVWFDGNDVVDWTNTMLQTADSQGRVIGKLLINGTYYDRYVLATEITVVVDGNNTNQTNQTACFSHIGQLPANCTGTITQDSTSGTCRTIACSNSAGSVNTLSCEKTDSGGTYFEMYRQSYTGTQPIVCLGNDCLKSGWGYQRDGYFPVCMNTTNTTRPPVNNTNQTFNGFDLAAVNISGPSNATSGDTVNITYTWKNDGNQNASDPAEGIYLATTPDINSTGTRIAEFGYAFTDPIIAPGQSVTITKTVQLPSDKSGTFYWGFIVNDDNHFNEVTYNNDAIAGNQITIQPPSGDPGATSRLYIPSGTVNGQGVSNTPGGSLNVVNVQPGAQITGTVNLTYQNSWPQGISVPLGVTPTWGDHATSFTSFGNADGTSKLVSFNYTAPTTPGDYYLIFAYRAEITPAQVFSATNWNYGSVVWNDGNDIAQWSLDQISTTSGFGATPAAWLFKNGMQNVTVPANILVIRVQNTTPQNTTPLNNTVCYNRVQNIPATCTGGSITSDTFNGCRQITCTNGSNNMQVLACDKPDGSSTPNHFEMYKQSQTGTSVSQVCLGSTCVGTNSGFNSASYPYCTQQWTINNDPNVDMSQFRLYNPPGPDFFLSDQEKLNYPSTIISPPYQFNLSNYPQGHEVVMLSVRYTFNATLQGPANVTTFFKDWDDQHTWTTKTQLPTGVFQSWVNAISGNAINGEVSVPGNYSATFQLVSANNTDKIGGNFTFFFKVLPS